MSLNGEIFDKFEYPKEYNTLFFNTNNFTMAAFDISWQGSLFQADKQAELVERIKKVANLYNDIYFAEEKDENTLVFFDHTTITDKIMISSSLLNIPTDATDNAILPLKKHSVSGLEYLCNEVNLFGVQFLIKSDISYTRETKGSLDAVSFVFWGFNSVTDKNPLIRYNVAQFSKKYSRYDKSFELTTPFVSARLLKLWFVIYLYEFVGHYYVKDLEIENTMFWENDQPSDFKEYMIENDPEGANPELMEKAFDVLLLEVDREAKLARDLDDIEIKHTKRSSNMYEDDYSTET